VDKTNPKIERVLSLVEPGRRDALRKILATAAYAAPVVASFSLDAAAQSVPTFGGNQICTGGNQTCGPNTLFLGTVKCKGFSLDTTVSNAVAQPVHLDFDVSVRLCEGSTGGRGSINGGPSGLNTSVLLSFDSVTFPDKNPNSETLGFTVADCSFPTYYETGQWTHTIMENGKEKLKGNSWVLMKRGPTAPTAYTLQCDYDLELAAPI
jgi:hypothetical protein